MPLKDLEYLTLPFRKECRRSPRSPQLQLPPGTTISISTASTIIAIQQNNYNDDYSDFIRKPVRYFSRSMLCFPLNGHQKVLRYLCFVHVMMVHAIMAYSKQLLSYDKTVLIVPHLPLMHTPSLYPISLFHCLLSIYH